MVDARLNVNHNILKRVIKIGHTQYRKNLIHKMDKFTYTISIHFHIQRRHIVDFSFI